MAKTSAGHSTLFYTIHIPTVYNFSVQYLCVCVHVGQYCMFILVDSDVQVVYRSIRLSLYQYIYDKRLEIV